MDLPDLLPVVVPYAGLRCGGKRAVRLLRFTLPGYYKRIFEEDVQPFVK